MRGLARHDCFGSRSCSGLAMPLPRLQQRRRATAPPGCGSGSFLLLLRAEGVARSHDCRRGIGIVGSRPSGRSLSRNAIVARVAPFGVGALLSLGESASRRRAEDDQDARALSQKARVPTVVNASLPADVSLPLEASVRRGWRESSKRSSASVGAGAPFRGEPAVRSPTGDVLCQPLWRLARRAAGLADVGLPSSAGRSALRAALRVTAAPAIRWLAAMSGTGPDAVGMVTVTCRCSAR